MAMETALSIKLVRERILKHITAFKDVQTVSMLNSEWYADTKKRLETTAILLAENEQIIHYTQTIKEPIINGRYMSITFFTDLVHESYKFHKAHRKKVIKRMPKLEPRINCLLMVTGSSIAVSEIMVLLKSSRNAKSISWAFQESIEKAKLQKLLKEIKASLKVANLCFKAKSLSLEGKSEIQWNFWVDDFIHYFPNLETLDVRGNENHIAIFFEELDALGRFETLRGLKTIIQLGDRIWNMFSERARCISKINLGIQEGDIFFLDQFLAKYHNQLENIRLSFHDAFKEMKIPPMKNLKKLEFYWAFKSSIHTAKVTLAEGNSYPRLWKLHLKAWGEKKIMQQFRDISTRVGLSNQLGLVIATPDMSNNAYFEWMRIGKEAVILKELNQLFPNANCKMRYSQMDFFGYPDNLPRDGEEAPQNTARGRKCLIQ